MAMAPYRYTLKMDCYTIAILDCYYFNGVGVPIFCPVSLDNFFADIYTFLSLVLTIDFCYSQLIFFCILFKKDKKIKERKKMKCSVKNKFIKEGWGVSLLNFKGGPGVPLLNFKGGRLGVPLLNLRGRSRVQLLNFGGRPRSWSHF